jgi:hypothetical protein
MRGGWDGVCRRDVLHHGGSLFLLVARPTRASHVFASHDTRVTNCTGMDVVFWSIGSRTFDYGMASLHFAAKIGSRGNQLFANTTRA